jgi:hypothetical protein
LIAWNFEGAKIGNSSKGAKGEGRNGWEIKNARLTYGFLIYQFIAACRRFNKKLDLLVVFVFHIKTISFYLYLSSSSFFLSPSSFKITSAKQKLQPP